MRSDKLEAQFAPHNFGGAHQGFERRAAVVGVEQAIKLGAPFRLRRASFKGEGLQADARGGSWSRLRDPTYEGRGA